MMWLKSENCPEQLFIEPHAVDTCAFFTYVLTLSGLRQACLDRKKKKKIEETGMLLEMTNMWTRGKMKMNWIRWGNEGQLWRVYFFLGHMQKHTYLHELWPRCSDLRRKHYWKFFVTRVRPSKRHKTWDRHMNQSWWVPLQNDMLAAQMWHDLTVTKRLLVWKSH